MSAFSSNARAPATVARAGRPGAGALPPPGPPGVNLSFEIRQESLAIAATGALGVRAQRLPQALELALHVVHEAEVSQAESPRAPAGDRLQGALPRLQVDVRRRRRRDRGPERRDAHPGDVADEGVAARFVEVGDVVARVTRGVGDPKALDPLAAAEGDDVGGRHGKHLAPEALQVVPIQPACAPEQLRRVDQMRRPDLVHVDTQLREPADERARGAGVIQVDVGEQRAPAARPRDPSAEPPGTRRGPDRRSGRPARRRRSRGRAPGA